MELDAKSIADAVAHLVGQRKQLSGRAAPVMHKGQCVIA